VPEPEVAPERSSSGARPRRLLVVEDSDRDYVLLTRELQKAGLDVTLHRVENAERFRAALSDGPWDAIISDHSLPQFSSTAALEIAREVERDTPFIIVSGAIGEEQAVDSMKAGAQDYVSKSNLRRLIPVLEREWREAEGRSERRRAEAEVAALNRERETRLLQRSTLLDITNAVVANLDRSSLFRSIFDALRNALDFDYLMIALSSREDGQIEVTSISDGRSPEEHTSLMAPGADPAFKTWGSGPGGLRIYSASRDDGAFPFAAELRKTRLRSAIGSPLTAKSKPFGFLIAASRGDDPYGPTQTEFFVEACYQIALAIENMLAYEQIAELKSQLERENAYLIEEIKTEHNFDEMIGSSPAFASLTSRIRRVAPTDAAVLILGETGTGKELIARALHNLSPRRSRPLVKVNCAAISAGLVESELFGHVRGAFTGAVDKRIGRFEYANGGTIFLDEVGELPLETQAKLLRVLQEQEFEPVGSNRSIKVDTRVIAATNRKLSDAISEGKFRSDLYYRLNVVPIEVPPLRERKEDIAQLTSFFLAGFSRKFGRSVKSVSHEAMAGILQYNWPGNIRELENVLARAVALSETSVLSAEALALPKDTRHPETPSAPAAAAEPPPDSPTLESAERRHILSVLTSAHWVVEGPRGAAKQLGLHANTLRSRMKKLGIRRPAAS
jgi:formate hydrogenlyase transcriptional activator